MSDICTIGHSTRTLDELVAALKAHSVQVLVDIRTAPSSRHVPQFNRSALEEALPGHGIDYVHIGELGGWRRPLPGSANSGWRSPAFRGYADYMGTDEFRLGLDRLMRIARSRLTAYMCAEAVPYRCHRSLVSDALTGRGFRVLHIMTPARAEPHRLTPFARIVGERVTYPAPS